jgi:hypothetical protein
MLERHSPKRNEFTLPGSWSTLPRAGDERLEGNRRLTEFVQAACRGRDAERRKRCQTPRMLRNLLRLLASWASHRLV